MLPALESSALTSEPHRPGAAIAAAVPAIVFENCRRVMKVIESSHHSCRSIHINEDTHPRCKRSASATLTSCQLKTVSLRQENSSSTDPGSNRRKPGGKIHAGFHCPKIDPQINITSPKPPI